MSSESQKICFGCKSEFQDKDKIHQFIFMDATYSIHAEVKCAVQAVNELVTAERLLLAEPNEATQRHKDDLLERIFKQICP